jgi:hypothetical protein
MEVYLLNGELIVLVLMRARGLPNCKWLQNNKLFDTADQRAEKNRKLLHHCGQEIPERVLKLADKFEIT